MFHVEQLRFKNGYNRMGIPRLLGLCFALLSFSTLAADPPVPRGNVSTTLNPTTSYFEVNRSSVNTPPGVSTSPMRDVTPHVNRYAGGMSQSMPTGITIEAINKTGAMSMSARATTNSMKNAAVRCLTGMKCNLALMAGAAGLQALFDSVEWIMGEGGQAQIPSATMPSVQGNTYCNYFPRSDFPIYAPNGSIHTITDTDTCPGGSTFANNCTNSNLGYTYNGALGRWPAECRTEPNQPVPPYLPADATDIQDDIDNKYNPEPSDWQFLSPQINLDDIEITSAPQLQSPPKTTTEYDANGNPIRVRETNIWWDFDIKDNPSPQPSLDLKKREEEKTYEDGELTGSTETTSTLPAVGIAGGGSNQPPIELDIPTDCDFMPTVCAFLDWFKEPNPEFEQEQDLSQLINDVDYERNYSINFGDNSCPAPISINVIFLNQTVELSYEPACELASYAKPFVLISAYIFAIFITLGVVRNG